MQCNYCGEPAALRIPSIPAEVCRAHAIEFWTGLMAYAKQDRSDFCEHDQPPSLCATCNESSAQKATSTDDRSPQEKVNRQDAA